MTESAFHLVPASEFAEIKTQIAGLREAIQTIPRAAESLSPWLSQDEAQQLLDCSRSTLHGYRRDGILPYSQIGRKIFFRREDIESLLEDHMQAA